MQCKEVVKTPRLEEVSAGEIAQEDLPKRNSHTITLSADFLGPKAQANSPLWNDLAPGSSDFCTNCWYGFVPLGPGWHSTQAPVPSLLARAYSLSPPANSQTHAA